MANIKSAAKRARQTTERTARNRSILSRVKNQEKKVLAQIKAGSREAASKELQLLSSVLDRAAKRGVIHKNAANRGKSRFNRAIAGLAA